MSATTTTCPLIEGGVIHLLVGPDVVNIILSYCSKITNSFINLQRVPPYKQLLFDKLIHDITSPSATNSAPGVSIPWRELPRANQTSGSINELKECIDLLTHMQIKKNLSVAKIWLTDLQANITTNLKKIAVQAVLNRFIILVDVYLTGKMLISEDAPNIPTAVALNMHNRSVKNNPLFWQKTTIIKKLVEGVSLSDRVDEDRHCHFSIKAKFPHLPAIEITCVHSSFDGEEMSVSDDDAQKRNLFFGRTDARQQNFNFSFPTINDYSMDNWMSNQSMLSKKDWVTIWILLSSATKICWPWPTMFERLSSDFNKRKVI